MDGTGDKPLVSGGFESNYVLSADRIYYTMRKDSDKQA